MSKMVQIRNVPDGVHQKLKIRAVEAGMSMSEYLLRQVVALAEHPTIDELRVRARQRRPDFPIDSAAEVRAERDSRL